MPKATDFQIRSAVQETEQFHYRTPIKFGGRVVTEAEVINVRLEIELQDGRRGTGTGSMPMGNAWAWPSRLLSGEQTVQAMRRFAERLIECANQPGEPGDPLAVTHRLGVEYARIADGVVRELSLTEPMPRLAQLVAASPFEAAVYDALGKTIEQNAYNLLGADYVAQDLAHYLNDDFRGEYLDQYTLRVPKRRMPLYHLVGALDPLEMTDVTQPVGDGLPETLAEWIPWNGLTHLKIKLAGDDLKWDVERVVAVERVAQRAQAARGCSAWQYSVDFNERCENVEYVLDFLAQVQERSPSAWERIQYIEQPTNRDLRSNPANRMHRAAEIKPVVIDESLVDFESLLLAREQGYSGVALKACKGQTEALLMGAAAQKYGMFLCVQDLTCIGASFLHSASLSARIPTVAAIEGNGRQYCPAGNRAWEDKYPGMFRITDGSVETALLDGPGLY